MFSITASPGRAVTTIALVFACIFVAVAMAACGTESKRGSPSSPQASASQSSLPQGSEPVNLNPADFTTKIDNPYFPLSPGSRWVYQEVHTDGPTPTVERVVVKATNKTKRIANGIEARVVRDVVSEDGVPVEVTSDWYAQDSAGNVWYMGEATTEYVNGKPATTKGSFEAGVDGAQPGIVMPAEPTEGLSYRQEYYAGQAEDKAAIVSLDEQAEPPFGHFKDVLITKDLNPLEPKVLEFKFYARDIGPVSTVGVSGGSKIEELVSFTPGKQ